ncbi:MAG: RsmE family RNA methyltransferase, partial [Puniceicoccales bacterium]|nr:RsmE family RNA methyltransferase [Puniceicoccales bacterium]
MNLILLTAEEAQAGELPGADVRAGHIRSVLRAGQGDTVYIGVEGGCRGLATLTVVSPGKVAWTVAWEPVPPPVLPLHLLVGLPRPQTARKILQEGASLGFSEIHFFGAEKGDPAYAQSSLWRDGEALELLRKGTEQAFTTRVPALSIHASLESALASLRPPVADAVSVFLDIYEAAAPLDAVLRDAPGAVLAIGPERGWSDAERETLRASGFKGGHLGERVLRV